MSLSEAIATQSVLLRLWVLWLTAIMFAGPIVMIWYRQSRHDGLIALGASVLVVVLMHLLYSFVGYTRLLGLPHVLVWTPLVGLLAVRLLQDRYDGAAKRAAQFMAASFLISLLFDYVDVVRYVAGERGSLILAS